MEPPMALGRVLPRLVALRYCGEVSMGAGHMIYGEASHEEGSHDIKKLSMTIVFFLLGVRPQALSWRCLLFWGSSKACG